MEPKGDRRFASIKQGGIRFCARYIKSWITCANISDGRARNLSWPYFSQRLVPAKWPFTSKTVYGDARLSSVPRSVSLLTSLATPRDWDAPMFHVPSSYSMRGSCVPPYA